MERLAEIFAHFDDVRIVIYVRPQDEMAAASYSTWVRDGQPVSFDIAHHITLENRYDFARIARRWANVFGQEALDIRLYPRRTLFEDFLSVIGVEETDKARWTSPPPSNVSLTDVELAFVLEMNRRLPRWSEGRPDNRFGNLTDVIEGSGLGERVTLSSAERNMILSRYQASNDWIMEHATNVEGRTDYFDAPRGEVPGNIHHQLSVDESNAFSAILWRAGARARSRLPGLSDK